MFLQRWFHDGLRPMSLGQVFAAWTALTGLAAAAPNSEVQVTARPERRETDYRVEADACRITWSVLQSKVNEGIAQYRAECSLPLSEQIGLNTKLLEAVLKREPKLHTLFLGSIHALPEVSQRLALAARQSPGWDAKAGRPKKGNLNTFVRDLAIRSDLLSEWQQMFKGARVMAAVAGIEKVIVSKAEELPYFPELQRQGVSPSDRLPTSALIWLTLSPLDDGAPVRVESGAAPGKN
jgi:hypothetical protein